MGIIVGRVSAAWVALMTETSAISRSGAPFTTPDDLSASDLPYSDAMSLQDARIHRAGDYSLELLREQKADTTISVCLPARNEAATIALIVETIRTELGTGDAALIDDLIVMDDGSTDATAAIATDAGAQVVAVDSVLPEHGTGRGKGNALWASVAATRGDLIVWIDADLRSFTPAYVMGLVGPMLDDPDVALVKGFYERPEHDGRGGGRTTELMARPLLATLFPHLSVIRQPLGGEYAARRSILEQLPFAQGYGAETGLLIDIAELVGVDHIAQVDLGVRAHRNRPLHELAPQAMEVLHAALRRSDRVDATELATLLVRADGSTAKVQVDERPPLGETPGYHGHVEGDR